MASRWRSTRSFALGDDDASSSSGSSPDGRREGIPPFRASRTPGAALSLSSMPRLRDTPNGFNEWLVCNAVEWAREHDFARVSLNFAPFAALLAPEAELTRAPAGRAACAAVVEGALPARQPAPLQPQVLPELAAALRRLRAPPRPAARRASPRSPPRRTCRSPAAARDARRGPAARARVGRRAERRLLRCSTQAASKLPPLTLRRPVHSLVAALSQRALARRVLPGIGGWVLYVAALALAPLSLVQATSAGGIGLLALLARHAACRGASGSASALSIARSRAARRSRSAAVAGRRRRRLDRRRRGLVRAARSSSRRSRPGRVRGCSRRAPASARQRACSTPRATSGRRPPSHGGARLAFVPAVLACHGLAFVALQLGFQRGGPLATAGVATLLTNALPIVAGIVVFAESLPGGVLRRAARRRVRARRRRRGGARRRAAIDADGYGARAGSARLLTD